MEEILCSASPLKLICLSGNTTSGCGVVDVSIQCVPGVQVSEVTFKNNYTASLAIKGKLPGNDGNYIKLVDNFQLMRSPHCANESQNIYKINFLEKGISDEMLTSLRFILRQPSSIWEKFSIEDIKLYKKTVQKKEVIPGDEKVVPQCDLPLDGIVHSLHGLMKQMEIIQKHHVEFGPLPFDINGCYDINLLSYT